MKQIVLVTGSMGLIGYETVKTFLQKGHRVIGIDNDLRSKIFNISTFYKIKLKALQRAYPEQYRHYDFDIRNIARMQTIFKTFKGKIGGVIHTAAQTSHDWAKKNPNLDFTVNAYATLRLLELCRSYVPKSTFIFTSTNKVYGDRVNRLPFLVQKTRFDLPKTHQLFNGVDEEFSIDQSTHSLFGVSKTSADLLVQEYGSYFNLNTGVFRLGVITGHEQSDSIFQGFLTYVIRHAIETKTMKIIGYGGRQVRDILHAKDLARAFLLFFKNPPRNASVYNMGGGRKNAISLLEVRNYLEKYLKKTVSVESQTTPRMGDHKWWITNHRKFNHDFGWKPAITVKEIIDSIISSQHAL